MKKLSKIFELLKIDKDDKAGLYLTIIFHLVIIIVLLVYSIGLQVSKETSFVLDFTKYEELEKEQKEAELKRSVSEELDELIAAGRKGTPRNVTVNRSSSALKDDRHSNPNEVYDDARRLQERLNASKEEAQKMEQEEEGISLEKKKKETKSDAAPYQGPSVLSWTLDGYRAISLNIPAYKCEGGGDVSVSIIVNKNGYVIGTKIIEGVSSEDRCLREYALKAAGTSRFMAKDKSNVPDRQVGEIVYRFIPQ